MKKTLMILLVTAISLGAIAQRKVMYTTGTVTSVNLSDMGRFPQGYETSVDIQADGIIDRDYTYVTVMVEFDGYEAIPCIAPSYMLPTNRKEGRLYTGCKVSIEIIKSGSRFGYPMKPREHENELMPQGAGAIKGRIVSMIG